MTLEDGDDCPKQEMKGNISYLLVEVLRRARREDRLTYGLYDAAKVMEVDPSNVMACILPQNHLDDVALHINHLLLEAFCHENYIHIVKVDCEEKMSCILQECDVENFDNDLTQDLTMPTPARNFSCILVQYPWESSSTADEDFILYCKETCDTFPTPIIELPGP